MSVTKTFPSYEIPNPVCACGKEIGMLDYDLNAKASFLKFAAEFGITDIGFMGFTTLETLNLKLCCLKELRFSCRLKIPITEGAVSGTTSGIGATRKFPQGEPGPRSHQEGLYWA